VTSRQDSAGLSSEVKAVAIVVIVGAIMSVLDTTIVNVAIDSLSRALHSPLSTIQWVSTGYLLSLATVIPLTGWAAERFGPKRVWTTAVAAFTVTSAMCGAAWSAESLIGFRVLQGFAGGMIMPIGMITLAQAAGPSRMGRVMSLVGVPILLAPVLGPVIGGLIVTNLSWRWIFYVNLPVGVVGLVLAARLMPAARAEGARPGSERLDRFGLATLAPGLALIVYGLSEIASRASLDLLREVAPLTVGALLVCAFGVHAWRHENPLVEVRLLRRPGFGAAAVTIFLVGAALFGVMLLLPLYYQIDRGLSALQAGLLIAPQGLGAAVAMRLSGPLTDRSGGGPVVIAGLLILGLGTLPFTEVGADTSYWVLAAAVFVRGIGLGFTMMPAIASAYALLERGEVPRATPMLNVLQRVGGSIGVALLAVVLEHQIRSALGGLAPSGASVHSLPTAARARLAEPIAHAFAQTYWWALALTVVALVPAFVLLRAQRGRPEAGPEGASERLPAPVG
jgi:EmrB/QacA subfamily drug resistance transporter